MAPDERDVRIATLERELAEARKQIEHWRANHAEQVRRKHRGVEIKEEIIAEQNREITDLRQQLADLKRREAT